MKAKVRELVEPMNGNGDDTTELNGDELTELVDPEEVFLTEDAPPVVQVRGNETADDYMVFMLDPSDIIEDEVTNVRPWGGSDDDQAEIEALAKSIAEVGQINPVEVRATDQGYMLMSGRRRRAAIILHNSICDKGEELQVRATVRVDVNDIDAFRHALVENAARKDASVMDNAQNIQTVRDKFKWKGASNTKKVANFFGMSPAWVTTHEKLLKLPTDVQAKIHSQGVPAIAAMALTIAEPENVEQVLTKATKEQEETTGKAVGKNNPLKAKHVKGAIREVEPDKVIARSRKEITEFFTQFDSTEYGYRNGAVRSFVNYFVDVWALGKGSDRTAREKFDKMTTDADGGTETAADKVKVDVEKDAAELKAKAKVKAEVKAKVEKVRSATKRAAAKKKK